MIYQTTVNRLSIALKVKVLDISNYIQNIWTRFSRLITKVKFICKTFTPPPFFIYMVPEVNDGFYQGEKSPNKLLIM